LEESRRRGAPPAAVLIRRPPRLENEGRLGRGLVGADDAVMHNDQAVPVPQTEPTNSGRPFT